MRRALALAARGAGCTSPNPMVGAVMYEGGEIVAEAYHQRAGAEHAEAEALRKAGARARGSTLVVTLEPCDHFGRTPPCTSIIIQSGVSRVVAAMGDPHGCVSGRGFRKLRENGVSVHVGLLEEDATWLNRAYLKSCGDGLPWVQMKVACSLDGKLATRTGASKYLTSEAARKVVHRLRAAADAVLVGGRTVQVDDPLLDCRLIRGKKAPGIVILDPRASVDPGAHLFSVERRRPAVVAVGPAARPEAREKLKAAGAEVWELEESPPGRLSLLGVLRRCHEAGLNHLLVEGGSEVFTSVLSQGLADELTLFVAPTIIGGDGLGLAGPLGVSALEDARSFRLRKLRRIGPDVMLQLLPTSQGARSQAPNPK
jgi:diaminohydroxyphosphoribosylaminopyrimidine deaminase/5-amino-6-(5-phosphoribosylamino)uracil reductase